VVRRSPLQTLMESYAQGGDVIAQLDRGMTAPLPDLEAVRLFCVAALQRAKGE